MKKIKLTLGKYTLVDDNIFNFLNKWKWVANNKRKDHYFNVVRTCYIGKKKTIYMHRLILKAKKGQIIDHINGNALDNRRKNLRFVTPSQNRINSPRKNKFGFKGIATHPEHSKYLVRIQINGKRHYLGTYKTPKQAAKAYDKAAKRLHGEFARLNFKK